MHDSREVQWLDIKGFEGLYMISNHGDVLNLNYKRSRRPGLITPSTNQLGYVSFGLTKNKKRHYFYAHRLVAEHFISKQPGFDEVNHLDGDKTNNHYTNLEWCTRSQNVQHSYDNGLKSTPSGTKHNRSKLSEKDVLDIRYYFDSGILTIYDLSKKYEVCKTTIYSVVKRKTYKTII